MQSVRILIVDDHQAIRRGLRSLLSSRGDWAICGEAADGCEAVEKARELRPDVILMDLSMPRMGGVEATRVIHREAPDSKVVIVSQNDPAVVRQQAREIGAKGFVAKTDLARDLLPMIENIVEAPATDAGKPDVSRASTEAQINAERLRTFFDKSALGLAVLDLKARFMEANEAFCVITGSSVRELKDSDFSKLLHVDDRERMRQQIERLVSSDIPSFVIDQRYVGKQGRTVWVQNTVSLTHDQAGNPLSIILLCQEFTEHQRLLGQLRESEQRFRDVIDALPVAIYTTDAEGRLTHFNPAAVDFAGHVPQIGVARWSIGWKLYHPDGKPWPLDECPMAVALKEGRIIECAEAIAERPDGSRLWARPFPRLLRNAEGQIVGGINMLIDVTASKKAEETTSLLAAIVDSSDDAIISKGLDSIITSWNKSAERLFGYTASEAIGQHIGLIIPRDRLQEEVGIIDRLKHGERVDHFETVRVRKDGERRDISVTISPVKDSSGRVVGASKVARDITERKRVEQSLADRVREQSAMFHLADQLHRAATIEDVYAAGLDAIFAAVQCDRASILLYDDSEVMRFVAWRGLSDAYRKATEGHSPWARDEANPAPVCIPQIDQADLSEAIKAVVKAEGISALAFIPLVSSGKLIGKFMMYFDAPHLCRDAELDLCLTIARQMAFGIDRKRGEEALRASEARFRDLSSRLDAEVRARTIELEQRNSELMWRSDQLRQISRRMMRVQDTERRHIARELHDSAGQTLAVLGLNMGSLAKKVPPDLKPESDEILQQVQQLSTEIRTMSYLLHPPLLDESGIADALNWYIDGLVQRSQMEIGLLISDNFGRLPAELELVIFRLVQECLTNIHRHSGSKSATIRIARQEDAVLLEVEDYGKGIQAQKLAQIQSSASGVGIRGMRERVRQFDGELKIDSNESGTKIFFRLPIPATPPQPDEPAAQPTEAVS